MTVEGSSTIRRRETTQDPDTGGAGDCGSELSSDDASKPSASSSSSSAVKKRRPEWEHYAKLSKLETAFYLLCATGSVLYVCYRVFRLSPMAFRMFANHAALRHGADPEFERPTGFWRKLGPVRDSTNHEWSIILWFWEKAWLGYLVHLVSSALLRHLGVGYRVRLFLLAIWCFCSLVGPIGFKVIASQYIYAFTGLVLARLTKRVLSVWLLSVFGLLLLNFPDGVPYLNGFSAFKFVFDRNDYQYQCYFVWVITLALTFNRTTSYCHEMLKRDFRDVEGDRCPISFYVLAVDLFNYVYYLPLLITGPLMTYDKFEDNLRADSPEYRRNHPHREVPQHLRLSLDRENLVYVAKFFGNLFRLGFWALITETILHKMYFGVMLKKHEFLRNSVDLWELAGIGYASGEFFYLKYLQMYGVHSILAHLDGMTPPKQPKCITRIYLYSDMFRNFDTGLYDFIKRHLYIPLGGSHNGFSRQLLTSAIVYGFIYFWHGAEYYIILWSAINFTTINLETVGRLLSKKPWVISLETRLGPRMWRRFRVALSTPLFLASTVGIFMFIGSSEEVLYIYWKRFFVDGPWSGGLLLTFFFMYTIAQCSVDFFKKEEKHLVEKSA